MEATKLFNLPSPLQRLDYALFNSKNVTVYVKRDDLIHPEISGNKWRKLKLNFEKYKQGGYDAILTFGGAYSNHIAATAALGKLFDIPCIGIIRGEELTANSNETLKAATVNGMQLFFVTREEYSWRYEDDYKHQLRNKFGHILIVEEGGANFYGMMGCTEIISEIDIQPDFYFVSAGTGTTTAGLLMAENKAKIIVVPALSNGDFLRKDILDLLTYGGLTDEDLIEKDEQLSLLTEFSFGGYGKVTAELIAFMNTFYKATQLPLDQIYTAKLFYALCRLIETGEIPSGSTVITIHTGGLQGNQSIKDKLIYP